ncbi:DUF5131 family protein [Acidithiobacillus ferrooxidans]|uniref:DUF5131 family protein n=1 Tax=Acidithiobacillus TaxID=119977 RepID=UPI0003172C18|nr:MULTISPECIES: DUF5131 family protein [Acidithiobacillus]MBN6745083.1 DUF5131 family protein [Acidithiobacillus sp. MC2.2]MBN6747990.1 DUF5131 family protein [Acidithiobacillus sp. PG05]
MGVSVEDQVTADERILLLLQAPAAVRWISAEPILGRIDLEHVRLDEDTYYNALTGDSLMLSHTIIPMENILNWVVLGGESGSDARAMDAHHLRSLIKQCQRSGIPVFVKQLGYRFMDLDNMVYGAGVPTTDTARQLRHRAGADMDEWPEDLRVREWPFALNFKEYGR